MKTMRSNGKPIHTASEIGRIVRARRKALGVTQTEAALLAGCSELFVGSVEAGKQTIRMDKLIALFDALGLEFSVKSRGDE